MLKYLDEIVGKDLDTSVILQLIFYFSIFMTPNAFPLAVLLSSLMTFGNLGEHFELTALKGAGISLIRVMVPIFIFSLLLTGVAYYSNNYIVPKANLKAFSLLYDVKQMKPSMELKEGAFYNGIEGFSIKVGKKLPDGESLKDLIIYDHTDGQGNKNITMADSGQMYNILNDRYLVLELYNGKSYLEQRTKKKNYLARQLPEPLVRNEFDEQKIVFSLASFDLTRTKEELFSGNRLMKNAGQLTADVDSMEFEFFDKTEEVKEHSFRFFEYHIQDIVSVYKKRAEEREEKKRQAEIRKEEALNNKKKAEYNLEEGELENRDISLEKSVDSISIISKHLSDSSRSIKFKKKANSNIKKENKVSAKPINKTSSTNFKKKIIDRKKKQKIAVDGKKALDTGVVKNSFEESITILDSLMNRPSAVKQAFNRSLTHVRYVKNNMMMRNSQLDKLKTEINKFNLERYKKLSYAIAILIMFLIGAPLGAIIKRGGLGMPVLISLSFFILFYVISMMCEKWTRADVMDPFLAAWMANIILLPVGIFFMRQAKNDARLFETDFYSVIFLRIKTYLFSIRSKLTKTKSLN